MTDIPKNIGKYDVISELGRGATSVVYLGHDPFAEREVAIKVFNPAGFPNDEERKKFSRLFMMEAAMAGKLNHPHIVSIYDAVVDGDMDYIVMELITGTALDVYATPDKLLPIPTVMQMMFKCCTALDFACQHGVIHRDIKPANIMYDEGGKIKITDFGAALMLNMEQTQVAGVGSPAYMSPEQVREDTLTHQADIYSLGIVMYKLLTGRFPFDAESTFALMHKIVNEEPLNIRGLRPDIPEALAAIVHKAIEKDTRKRYQKWGDFGANLAACVMPSAAAKKTAAGITDSEKFNTLKDLPFFSDFNEVELWEVLHLVEWGKAPTGKVLIKEGDGGNEFYLITEGEVYVTKTGKWLTELKKGDCVGEMAYIDNSVSQRSATIVSATPVAFIRIDANALDKSSDNLQLKFNRAFLKILVKRLALTNKELAALVP
jgi:eukaryotic-like serine/threonine-protein kinase